MQRTQGFTLIELMITIAIAGIILAFSAPWLGNFIQDYRSFSETNQLINTLSLAKSEAIKRSTEVSLELSRNTNPGSLDDWRYSWSIYLDANANNTLDAGERIIKEGQGDLELSIADNLTTNTGNLRFNAKGLITASNINQDANGNFILRVCDERREGTSFELNRIGRAEKTKHSSKNSPANLIPATQCNYRL
ncbi:GspH/FimT family pseudopilin [Spartinivicinus poritis]|uniref:Type II secretion system protein H n=1 Tax=Spartinivicinus poritis TaxID=2994640 RepID=A0ABT5U2L5_9GAMM|nr:GspH/FimT family pseudopilin [Spartinivicinus sp. A2-2]MDE1460532.1 GspH/FimT family pseudopilin [Spartinivicinus sp. A2-2]